MASIMDMLNHAVRMDLQRLAKNEVVPSRGVRKHVSQMNNKEIDYIFDKLRSIKKWRATSHAMDRVNTKGIYITLRDMVSTIHHSRVIEYHEVRGEKRVLLRSNVLIQGDYNLHVVFSVNEAKIISVWLNHVDDTHETIDMSCYNEKLKIEF